IFDRSHVMRDKKHCSPAFAQVLHEAKALLLKDCIANSQYFIDDQDVGIQMCSNRKPQSQAHSGGIALDGSIDEPFDTGKLDNLIEFFIDFLLFHAQDRSIQVNIFPSRKLLMETSADLQQGGNSAVNLHAPRCGIGNLGEDFQQGALPRAVPANNSHDLSFPYGKRNVLERPEDVSGTSGAGKGVLQEIHNPLSEHGLLISLPEQIPL